MFSSLKTVAAVALIAYVQAAPLVARCVGDECNQSASSGNVNLGSTTNIAPVTNVTPITRYQPYVQAFAPLVQSECDDDFDSQSDFSGLGYGGSMYGSGFYGRNSGFYGSGLYRSGVYGNSLYGPGYGRGGLYGGSIRNNGGLFKRNHLDASSSDLSGTGASSSGNLLFSQFQHNCAENSDAEGCQTSVPAQSVDMGSQVTAQPTNEIYPSTSYQAHVQSLGADIQASAAESHQLPQQNVNLGSNVAIQPTTQVVPQTTYQPTVNQLATSIQAAPQQDQSLPQSTIQLGSSVQISPQVQVTPLTTFQPSIQSLPFIINAEPCDNSDVTSIGSSGWNSATTYPSTSYAGSNYASAFPSSGASYHSPSYPSSITSGSSGATSSIQDCA
ncbi:hypothetical protein BGZ83_012142 [Gryganskiella cystojenkinii]|nr:hypothetical protein BGZ83_012142 [Gryganskiella cystojenkinii]